MTLVTIRLGPAIITYEREIRRTRRDPIFAKSSSQSFFPAREINRRVGPLFQTKVDDGTDRATNVGGKLGVVGQILELIGNEVPHITTKWSDSGTPFYGNVVNIESSKEFLGTRLEG